MIDAVRYSSVTSNLVLGPDPWTPDHLRALKRERVTAILSLQTEEDRGKRGNEWEESVARQQGFVFRNVPILDFNNADLLRKLPEAVAVLDELLKAGHTVYVHCSAGVSRSPTVVVAYLYWCLDWPLQGALEQVQRVRMCSPNREAIEHAVWPKSPGTS